MRSIVVALSVAAGAMSLSARPAAAQHATAYDVSDGKRAYGEFCVTCHGPDGDLIADIDFGRGLYRRDLSDDEIIAIIRSGIPETPMPPSPQISEPQAERIVAYLRSLPESSGLDRLAGDPGRGRELFTGKGECTGCHAVDGLGSRTGPDLSTIGAERRAIELESALLDPGAAVQPTARSFEVRLAGGDVVTGRLLNHDTFTVQMIDDDEALRSFTKASLEDYGFIDTPMPAYGDRLSAREIADLVSYLASLH